MDGSTPWWSTPLFEGLAVTPVRIVLGIGILVIGWLTSRWAALVLGRHESKGRLDPGARYSL